MLYSSRNQEESSKHSGACLSGFHCRSEDGAREPLELTKAPEIWGAPCSTFLFFPYQYSRPQHYHLPRDLSTVFVTLISALLQLPQGGLRAPVTAWTLIPSQLQHLITQTLPPDPHACLPRRPWKPQSTNSKSLTFAACISKILHSPTCSNWNPTSREDSAAASPATPCTGSSSLCHGSCTPGPGGAEAVLFDLYYLFLSDCSFPVLPRPNPPRSESQYCKLLPPSLLHHLQTPWATAPYSLRP